MRRLGWASALAVLLGSGTASARALRADLIGDKPIKVDGVPKEWAPMNSLSHQVKGTAGKGDLEARAGVAYDDKNLYFAAEVTDDVLKGGGDKVVVTIGFPGGKTHEITLKPGEPGKSAAAGLIDDKASASVKVVEAPVSGGWTLEAVVPWSALPHAKTTRIGLRGAISVHDADATTAVEGVVSTSASTAYASMPALSMQPEQALSDGLLRENRLSGTPKYNLVADVVGDAQVERVLVFDRFLVVLGPGFRSGKEYYYADLAASASQGMIPQFEVREVTGDGKGDVLVRKRIGAPSKYREVYQVLSFHGGLDTPSPVFQHEVGIATSAGSIANTVSILGSGATAQIKVEPGRATGFEASSYGEPTETSIDALLLPWGGVKSQLYKWSAGGFSKVGEEKNAEKGGSAPSAPAAASAAPAAPAPKPAPAPSAAELLDKVYSLYKKDRGVSGNARFDMAVDVAGDSQRERVLLHGREIVVFGKGYKNGTGYTYLALPQFSLPRDITDMTATDLTGDGKAEIVVRGLVMGQAPKEAGGGGIAREVVLIFQLVGDQLKRVFAAETARNVGKGRVVGAMKFVANGKAHEIELAPGRAEKITESEYPFAQDTSAVGGFEPLLLPWGGAKAVRYKWNGSAFVK